VQKKKEKQCRRPSRKPFECHVGGKKKRKYYAPNDARAINSGCAARLVYGWAVIKKPEKQNAAGGKEKSFQAIEGNQTIECRL